jgi:hypothetical protein
MGVCLLPLKEAELINFNRLTTKCHMLLHQISKFSPQASILLIRLLCTLLIKLCLVSFNAVGFLKSCVQIIFTVKFKSSSCCFAESCFLSFPNCSFH